MVINHLRAKEGNKVIVQLLNGNKISGTLSEVNEETFRVDTEMGTATLRVDSVKDIWDNTELSLTGEDLVEIVEKVSDISAIRYVCLGGNGFSCPQNYTCRPPHACNNFSCPGLFNSGFVPPDQPCTGQFFGYKR